MKISLNWLRQFVDININEQKANLEKVVVGFVESIASHPNADRLRVAQVNIGSETVQIVCGGVNLTEKTYVPVALPGAVLPGNFAIKKSVIRGIESHGMICNQIELEIGECDPKNIMILPKKGTPGESFSDYLNLKGYSPQEIGNLLTLKTAEVEEIINLKEKLNNIVAGKLISFQKIPNKPQHHEGLVDIGKEQISIVFGSVFELTEGWILPIALPGAMTSIGEIKETSVHGVKSQGMICSDKEMNIENSTSGLTVFPSDTPLGTPIAELLFLNDFQLEIDNKSITHRPDLWGHYGLAREVAALTDKKLKPYNASANFPQKGDELNIIIEEGSLCHNFTGCLISGIKIEESPAWIKGRLQAAGLRPVNNIVDVTNYIMLEYGQPMHAFDRDIVKTDTLQIKKAGKGEKVTTIDHKTRTLTQEDIIITNGENFLSVAGIIGGLDSEINDNTTNIILEAACWPASTIRQTSQRIGVRTDASQRFEKSLDPQMCKTAITKAAEIILQICPQAKIVSPLVEATNSKPKKISSNLSISRTQSKVGKNISAQEMQKILESLEFKVQTHDQDTFVVEIPSFRATKDIAIEDDLIEEIIRIHGYDNIEPKLPTLPIKVPSLNIERKFKNTLREIFSLQLGFSEVYNYSFYGISEIQKTLLNEDEHIQLENYLSEDQTHMRTTLVPNMLKAIQGNLRYFTEFQIYEIGRSYKEIGEYFPLEEKMLVGAVILDKKSKSDAYRKIKGAIEASLGKLNYEYTFAKSNNPAPYAHPAQSTDIIINSVVVGQIFTTHPIVERNFELENSKIALFEINLNKLLSHKAKEKKFQEINKFPDIEIDISVVVKKKKTIGEMLEIIKQAGNELISNIELFDIYEGPNVEAGTKALAFRVTLQAKDRTLTDKEMAAVQDKIFKSLISNGGKIRGL